MASSTWIDVASGIFDRFVSPASSDIPFNEQQKVVLEEVLRQFGEGIGMEIGKRIGGLCDRYNDHIAAMQHTVDHLSSRIDEFESKRSPSHADAKSFDRSQCAAASQGGVAASSRPSKTQLRRMRRKRCNEKGQLSRCSLLKLRPSKEVHQMCDFNRRPLVKDAVTLNLASIIPLPEHPHGDGHASTDLGKQHNHGFCDDKHVESARLIQRWFRGLRNFCSSSDNSHAALWQGRTSNPDHGEANFALAVDSLLKTRQENRELTKYRFLPANFIRKLFEKPNVKVLRVSVYASATIAMMTYIWNGETRETLYNIEDKQELVELVQEHGTRIQSFLQKPPPSVDNKRHC